ncbi:alpha/beta fold hydrolase [Alcanivorax sp. 1008]|uniref:alpha/beta fold hydrolase n=1 Tax=Alcanivorax sp. 1008 TaxID=2816853 RepID=UPI001D46DA0D|nr:alpha/beta fold hydrolase [Alcanivorax sp. 1008]MCC1496087.1 alpha/beta fold hydrolase [Alcanivorax sp. 1008]
MSYKDVVSAWKSRGQPLAVDGANTRIWREGNGEPVVCLHGVPASGFLYRKVIPELASRGLEGVTFDLPGMGFADRPESFDYSWSGLARWTVKAIDAAGIKDFHLVVHDIGGPIGFDVIRQMPGRIRSLTVLNTLVRAASFHRPWVMEPFAHPFIGPIWLASTRTPMIIPLMRAIGMHDGPSSDELRAYGHLLSLEDGGKAFLKVMQGFERTPEFEERIVTALRARQFPAQVIWGAQDPALKMARYAPEICEVLGLDSWHQVRGKHFLQEDSPAEIADLVAALV